MEECKTTKRHRKTLNWCTLTDTLFLITARGGSKGLPGKNIKPLAGVPLLHLSIELARSFTTDSNICLSTDDPQIIACAGEIGLSVPFVRPDELASDTAGSYGVILHALEYYEQQGIEYEKVVLLQPTSPFRKRAHVEMALSAWSSEIDGVLSVHLTEDNPYYVLAEDDDRGYLRLSKSHTATRRQDVPPVYRINGAIYVLTSSSLRRYNRIMDFDRLKKVVIPAIDAVDIDTPFDWKYCEFLLDSGTQSLELRDKGN